MQLVTESVA
jgi:transposase